MSKESNQEQLPEEAQLHRHCRRCHRKLKSPVAMKVGYGRVCAKKARHEQ